MQIMMRVVLMCCGHARDFCHFCLDVCIYAQRQECLDNGLVEALSQDAGSTDPSGCAASGMTEKLRSQGTTLPQG